MENENLELFYKQYNLIKVSWYYYIEGLTQQEIADIMGVSRMKINKMLDEARQNNLIQFVIPVQTRGQLEIEKKLINQFNLDDAFVIPVANENNINEALGKAAAMYINNLLRDNTFINFGYGDTLNHLISYLSIISEAKISIVSLTGGITPYLPSKGNVNLNVNLNLIPSPLFMNNKTAAENMFTEKSVQEVFALAKLASFNVTGIGEVSDESTIVKQGILTQHDILKLQLQGAVSDILMHFIDKNGKPISSEFEDRVISTSLEELKARNNTIAVAGGDHKVDAILAALNTNIFSRLVTSESTAKQLIERSQESE